MSKFVMLGIAAIGVAAMFSSPAMGQPTHAQPASFLIYPLFNSTDGNNTIISVTNTNQDERSCGFGLRQGDVMIHFVYTDGDTWQLSDRDEDLTPADQVVVLARGHNPNQETGFLTVEARDPESGNPLEFNHLIGSAHIVNSEFDFEWAYTPYPFLGNPNDNINRGQDRCSRDFTDFAGSGDSTTVDFNGTEYSKFPDILYLDQFFGEGTPAGKNISFSNTLYLMATSPNRTDVRMLGWNNNERRFSRTFDFNCWTETTLSELTNAVTQANLAVRSNLSEAEGVATGWLQLQASTSSNGMLGVFVQRSTIASDTFTAGRELQFEGTRTTTLPRIDLF